MSKKIVLRLIAAAVTVGIGVWINYLFTPAWNIKSGGLWIFCMVMAVIAIVAFAIVEKIISNDEDSHVYVGTGIFIVILVILLVAGLVCSITGWELFRSGDYRDMISFEDGNFEEDIPQLSDINNLSIVDVKTAQNLGDRTIGTLKNSTWYDVADEYNLIKFKEEYYRISELKYGGLFKYNKAKYDGIPGYVLVNIATQKAQYVELKEPIRYSPSGHFEHQLKRHLRGQYPSDIFGTSFFEIDDEGNPYYITSVVTHTIGMFGGNKEESFIITDAANGKSEKYKTDELPSWVDHAYDLEYLMKVINYHQKYVNGFFNFSKTGVNKTSYQFKDEDFDGYNTAITKNGEIVFFTGVTPANGAESNIGFILANPRTGIITYYTCDGAEESSAQTAAEGLVQNLGYTATMPTIINIDGQETYFMLLKDKGGLVQRYALCNVKDYTKVVQAENIETTIALYQEKMGMEVTFDSEPEVEPEPEVELLKKTGTIEKLYQAEIDGCTFYYFTFEESTDLYMSSIKNSNKQVLLEAGQTISIEYTESYEENVYVIKKIQF